MKSINKLRRKLYKSASLLGDLNAVASGNPKKIAKRFARKRVGRFSGKRIYRLFK